ncbi:BMA-ETR-1, isoform f [Aphelenchoides fujianensis]|nr:BMA-ETR-1, isoform f [Aphelenchoides fujianensis]
MSQAADEEQRPPAAEPDPDTIKMFVGQIPRDWTEAECRELFEEFGPVHQLNVLRDKQTQASRGCCFVTFFHRQDAIAAQDKLHNVRVLPQMNHAVQMKPADVENRNERKLFIGMLNKSMNEEDVKGMFKEFGQIEECTVLREDGKSRGCAFVTFVNRSCATIAIRQMHQSRTLEGCSKPIVVKFADSQQKDRKQAGPSITSLGGDSSDQTALLAQLLQQQKRASPQTAALTSQLMGLNALLEQPGILNLIGTVISSLTSTAASSAPVQNAGLPTAQMQLNAMLQQQNMAELLRQQGQPKDSPFNLSGYLPTSTQLVSNPSAFPGMSLSPTSMLQFGGMSANTPIAHQQPSVLNQSYDDALLAAKAGSAASLAPYLRSQLAGYGAGPTNYQDADLCQLFAPFGNILSAKVFIDKQTNLSKCFGFISFDNALSAQNAIAAMNGFQVNSKRLKVQLKRSKAQPYATPIPNSAALINNS